MTSAPSRLIDASASVLNLCGTGSGANRPREVVCWIVDNTARLVVDERMPLGAAADNRDRSVEEGIISTGTSAVGVDDSALPFGQWSFAVGLFGVAVI